MYLDLESIKIKILASCQQRKGPRPLEGPSPGKVKFYEVPLTDLTEKCGVQTLSECQLAAANPPFYLISVNSIR